MIEKGERMMDGSQTDQRCLCRQLMLQLFDLSRNIFTPPLLDSNDQTELNQREERRDTENSACHSAIR